MVYIRLVKALIDTIQFLDLAKLCLYELMYVGFLDVPAIKTETSFMQIRVFVLIDHITVRSNGLLLSGK